METELFVWIVTMQYHEWDLYSVPQNRWDDRSRDMAGQQRQEGEAIPPPTGWIGWQPFHHSTSRTTTCVSAFQWVCFSQWTEVPPLCIHQWRVVQTNNDTHTRVKNPALFTLLVQSPRSGGYCTRTDRHPISASTHTPAGRLRESCCTVLVYGVVYYGTTHDGKPP